jgi:hypothetical protein
MRYWKQPGRQINFKIRHYPGGKIMAIVLTMYGHEKNIDKIALSSFDSDSRTYCDMINALKLEGDSWVYAKEIPENTPLDLNMLVPSMFSDLILSLENRTLQSVLWVVDNRELAEALKGASDAVLDKVFQNMTKRRDIMLKEDMEYIGPLCSENIEKSRDKIISIIQHHAFRRFT